MTIGAFVLIGVVLACITKKWVAIVSTSFIGSYLILRAIGTWAGGFPNSF